MLPAQLQRLMVLSCLAISLLATGARAQDLTLATWNLEWLMTSQTYSQLLPSCDKTGQPRSQEHRFPCSPDRPPLPKRGPADFKALARIAESIKADLVALQEVDGPEAGARVFGKGWVLDCFIQRLHPQKVGFAIRQGVPYQCNAELAALDIDGSSRAGADITLYPGTKQALRVLGVHLKSGCFAGPLWKKGPCPRLREQIPVLERWLDARAQAGEAFVLAGDFNRRLEKDAQYPAGPDEQAPTSMFAALSDNQPQGAELIRATQNWAETPCSSQDKYSQGAIDNILISTSLAKRAKTLAVHRVPFAHEDVENFVLSDHCPLVMQLKGL